MLKKQLSVKKRWKSSLAVKQLTYILLFSSLITLLGTFIQLYMEYLADIGFVKNQIEQVESAHLDSLTNSLWDFDKGQIRTQLNSILNIRDIVYLEINVKNRPIFSAGHYDKSKNNITSELKMITNFHDRKKKIGSLHVVASLEGVYSRLYNRVLIILVTQGMKTFLVSMFILYIIHHLVTRHVFMLVNYAKKMDLNTPNSNLVLKKKSLFETEPDEIDQLVTALNDMYQRLITTFARQKQSDKALKESEKKYRSLFSSVNEGFCLHKFIYDQKGQAIDYIILDVNPAYETILGIKFKEAVDMKASQLYGTQQAPYLDIYLKVAETGEPVSFETFFPPLESYFKISVFSHEKGQFATLFADITEQKKAEEKIKASLKEKKVLLKEIHHRVKNNMQVIISLLKLQSENITDKQTLDLFIESQNRIKSMALVHEKLYQTKSLADVDFKGYIKSLVNSLLRSYGTNPDKVALKIEVADVSLELESAIPCGLIINELVSNSLKYAFPEKREGEIRVAFNLINNDELLLEVSDSGIGMPKNLDIKNSGTMGLHLVTILSEDQLQGHIELSRIGGTHFYIQFKKHIYKTRI